MISEDNDDFVVITDKPFPYSYKDAKLFFDVAWKEVGSRIVINCRDISRKNQSNIKIISTTIPEFKGIHNEISAIEPKINPYFPENFTFETLTIERPNTKQSWFFSFQPATVFEESRVLSEESVTDIQNYLRAVLEICGKQILFDVFFKEENTVYFEDNEAFILKKSEENILECKIHCLELLKHHAEFENLQSLTEDLYKQEDLALEKYKEALFDGYFISYNKMNEKIEVLIEQIQKLLSNRQNSEIGPRIIDEINKSITERLNEYYSQQRILINFKLELSKNLRSLYSCFLAEMLNDKSKYEILIFRDCVGLRLENLSVLYHTENENVSHYNLLMHSADDIIVKRKLQLIHQWQHGQEMTKPNVRHEDYSLIQLKNLNIANIELSEIDHFHSYITQAYKLLLIYYEARREKFTNQKQTINDPTNVVPPSQSSVKSLLKNFKKISSNEIDLNKSIDMSLMLYFEKHESDDEFEDAMDEINFEDMKKFETEKLKLKENIENELKSIANIKAELRNSQHHLKVQYDRLIKKVNVSEDSLDSIAFTSLHPESKAKQMRKQLPKPGTSLTKEQRLIESKKATERIRNFNKKLGIIPEKVTKRKTDPSSNISNPQSISSIVVPSQPATMVKLPSPIPPPPPLPPLPPTSPPVMQPSQPPSINRIKLSPDNKNSKDRVVEKDFLSELKSKMSARKYQENDIDKQVQQNKKSNVFANQFSLMIDQRRLGIKSNSESGDEFDEEI